MSSIFLTKHQALATALGSSFPTYSIAKSEIELEQGTFPAIGLFLGISEHSKESIAYAPISYTYILSVFDIFDIDDPADYSSKQSSTFEKLEDVITTMGYEVLTDIEPVVSIGIGEGQFITGWITTIVFNA